MTKPSFLFYDLETFGINPQLDRIAQFACIRTDEELHIIEDPVVLYCKITADYLPDLEACILTGITPTETLEKGLCENEFIERINAIFSVPKTCVLGYNNVRFDDEFIRNALYRNFFDPYRREWAEGNSRWDLIDMVRLTHDLRPGNIIWPLNDDQKPSFRLEDLAKANHLTDKASHDALVDVRNTIALAQLIYENNPKLFTYCFSHRDKNAISKMISLKEKTIWVHTSRMLASDYGCTSLVVPLLSHPLRNNAVISYDLRYDPDSLIHLPIEELERLIFVSKDDPDYANRIRLKGIAFNKCPILAPVSVLDEDSYSRLHISKAVCQQHFEQLMKAEKDIIAKLTIIYGKEPIYETPSNDPDRQIYSGGFFSDNDRDQFTRLHKAKIADLPTFTLTTKDPRVPEMFFRWKGRNYNDALSPTDKNRWASFCQEQQQQALAHRHQTIEDYNKQLSAYPQFRNPI